MRIERLTLHNWMAFRGHHDLALGEGAISIVGPNWSGKTALVEAIEWCLFGRHRKRYDSDLITRGEREAGVTIILAGGPRVTRTLSMDGPARLEVLEPGPRGRLVKRLQEGQQLVVDTLGVDPQGYRETVYFAQGDVLAVVGLPSGKRKAAMSRWLRLDMWAEAGQLANQERDETIQRLGALRAKLEQTPEPTVQGLGALDTLTGGDAIAWAVGTAAGRALGAALRAEDQEANRALAYRAGQARATLQAAEQRSREARAKLVGRAEVDQRSAAAQAQETNAATRLQQCHRDLDQAARLARGEFQGQCPVTREGCPVAVEIRAKTQQGQALHRAASDAYSAASRAHEVAYQQAREARAQLDELIRTTERFNQDTREVRQARQTLAETGDQGPVPESGRVEAQRAAGVLAATLVEERRYYETVRQRQHLIGQVELVAREVQVARLVAGALGPSGIPRMLAERDMGQLTDRVNALLSESGLRIEVQWGRATREDEAACHACQEPFGSGRDKVCRACGTPRGPKMAEDLELLVDDGSGVIEDVGAKSGGAQTLVASAVRLAASALFRDHRGMRLGWAVIDEPFGFLDDQHRPQLARIFSSQLGLVGLEQALVISHDPGLLDGLPGRLIVSRVGQDSIVEVV